VEQKSQTVRLSYQTPHSCGPTSVAGQQVADFNGNGAKHLWLSYFSIQWGMAHNNLWHEVDVID
jgi:hypothetical protein